jgi:MFS family permease
MTPPAASAKRRMRRVAVASAVGSIIEFYDFTVYATASALVFSKAFFPSLGAAAGSVVALATFGVAFVMRPLGALLFGHVGDKIGRKTTLVWTLILMGLATVGVGLLPTAASIGIAAPILLTILRCVQGLAMGGEWAGASLMTAENAASHQRGRYGIAPQLGPSFGFILSSLTFLAISLTLAPAAFASWGWRLPFFASAILIIVGLVVRFTLEETPEFSDAKRQERPSSDRFPVVELFSRQWRELALATGATTAIFALFYIAVAYIPSYATSTLKIPQSAVLIAGIAGGIALTVTVVVSAIWSDHAGRKKVLIVGNFCLLAAALAVFPILSATSFASLLVGLIVLQAAVGLAYGPLAAYLPELFATRHRYTGAGLAYNFATVLGAAVSPLISDLLIRQVGLGMLMVYLAAVCVVTLVCLFFSRETANIRNIEAKAGARPRSYIGE